MKIMILFLMFLFLTACQSTLIPTNHHYLEAGSHSTIEITQKIEVFPDSARAFFQNGKIIAVDNLDLYTVHCEIEINSMTESHQSINPGLFNIVAIVQEESPIVMTKPIMLASLQYASSTPPDTKRFFRFRLAPQEPGTKSKVKALICRGVQAAHNEAELPTLEEMQSAVGRYIIFNL